MPDWTWDWPTESGWYWFYGWLSVFGQRDRDVPKTLHLVQVKGKFAVSGSQFVSRGEGSRGQWTPAILPQTPEDTCKVCGDHGGQFLGSRGWISEPCIECGFTKTS